MFLPSQQMKGLPVQSASYGSLLGLLAGKASFVLKDKGINTQSCLILVRPLVCLAL